MAIANNALPRRGTTPTLTIMTDIDVSEFEYCEVTFVARQPAKSYPPETAVVLTKTAPYVVCVRKSIIVTLTQEDTLQLGENNPDIDATIEFQVRARDHTGSALASNIMLLTLGRILKGGVI
ncbi:MAG: hypothetical protein RRY79_05060 [Clostridia bacterium]